VVVTVIRRRVSCRPTRTALHCFVQNEAGQKGPLEGLCLLVSQAQRCWRVIKGRIGAPPFETMLGTGPVSPGSGDAYSLSSAQCLLA